MAMTEKVSLLISDENRLFREGIRRILGSRKMEVVGEVRSLVEAADALRMTHSSVNLLLCDPSTDIQEEFAAMKDIAHELPHIKIVLLTNRIALGWLDLAIEAGASGFLPKDISADALRYSLELVLLGEQIFPTVHSLLENKAHQAAISSEVTIELPRNIPLSARESQILSCLVNGLPNKTIARNLNMAEATVKVHLKALLRKINARNRTQAAIWGMNHVAREIPDRRACDNVIPSALTFASSTDGL
jgi:two-component system nitrate/nitrite response regulator NarL